MDTSAFGTSQFDPASIGAAGGLIAFFIAYIAFVVVVSVGMYVLMGITHHKIYKKAGVKYPWMAWIPIVNSIPFFWTIKKSALNLLWALVPLVLFIIGLAAHSTVLLVVTGISYLAMIVLYIWWYARFLKAFRISPHWLWCLFGLIVPFVNMLVGVGFIVLICIIAFNKNVTYNPDFDRKGPNDPNDPGVTA